MQPYFFPYIGYFDLINVTDTWVVFDTAQYIRHGWVNRNRIRKPGGGWQYIIVPLQQHSHNAAIRDVRVLGGDAWRRRIIGQLAVYGRAPYFHQTVRVVRESLATNATTVAQLNTHILEVICAHLQLPFNYKVHSTMGSSLGQVDSPDDWAVRLVETLGADEYVNPIGGEGLYHAEKFARLSARLVIRPMITAPAGAGNEFVPPLSIIDTLMYASPTQVREYLLALRDSAA